jgi:hypothetical protein
MSGDTLTTKLGGMWYAALANAAMPSFDSQGRLHACSGEILPGESPPVVLRTANEARGRSESPTFHRISWWQASTLRDPLVMVQVFLHVGSSAALTI